MIPPFLLRYHFSTTCEAKVKDHAIFVLCNREYFALPAFNESLFALSPSQILFSSSLTMAKNIHKSPCLKNRYVSSSNIIGSSTEELGR